MTKRKRSYHSSSSRHGEAIVFDPDARANYLRGFSQRKQQRRAFGLAMQKVKERKARLEQRAQTREAMNEQVEEAEKQKEQFLTELVLENKVDDFEENNNEEDGKTVRTDSVGTKLEDVNQVQTYEDVQTQSHWGGEVIVRTTTKIPGDESDEDEGGKRPKRRRKLIDEAQLNAGKVDKYLAQLKGNMPSKKKKDRHIKHKGRHGASSMKGMASGGEFKLAQKVLERSKGNARSRGPPAKTAGRKKK